jgi:hypothetical protein
MGAYWVVGVSSQEAEKPQGKEAMESHEAMVAKYGQPGEHHARLEEMVGIWKMAGTSWMAPGAEPMSWEGVAEKEMILGGRFLREEVKSEMMGMPFNGIGIVGYDNVQDKYMWYWIDDMSTGMMMSDGTADETGKVVTLLGKYMDPATQTMQAVKSIVKITGEDTHMFEMHMMDAEGGGYKSMEIAYERAE